MSLLTNESGLRSNATQLSFRLLAFGEFMKKLRILVIAACTACGVTSAQSADQPRIETVAPPAVNNWQGAYFGGVVGIGWMHTRDVATFGGAAVGTVTLNGAGPTIGGTLGYNWAFNSRWLIGAEADLSFSAISADNNSVCNPGCETGMDWLSTIRGRAGYAQGPWLAYLTAGAAMAGFHIHQPVNFDFKETKLGAAVGGGIEYKLAADWSVKAEYQYLSFGSGDSHPIVFVGGVRVHRDATYAHLFRVGLNRFF
jgi:outer membrane immunogenic protein